ncbi:MAG: DegT/DnrJ/EryC1/StrS family aminotransferase [Dethiobacteria bacterium]|jgi:dTDP-4-amino-4,6-dideoxygalactose transaminase
MKVPSFSLSEQNRVHRDELMTAIEEVVSSGMFILGKTVEEFEQSLAHYCGVKHAIGVANGSDALYIALAAMGIGEGDEVITTPFTFFATAGSIVRTGATPVFADIDPRTFNLDPAEVARKTTLRTKAVMPVQLFGQPCNMDPINDIAKKHGLKVVEDAAQAIGATYKGQKVGTLGDAACISFFPTKNLGAFGDAGAIVTDDDEIADTCRMLRAHGSKKKYVHEMMGINSRLDALQAKILKVKLQYLDEWANRRRAVAAKYNELLGTLSRVRVPYVDEGCHHVYHQYTICVEDRDSLRAHLSEEGVASTVYYPIPLHLQKVFANLGYKEGDFPNSERACKTVLSLPMFPELSRAEIVAVADTIASFVKA